MTDLIGCYKKCILLITLGTELCIFQCGKRDQESGTSHMVLNHVFPTSQDYLGQGIRNSLKMVAGGRLSEQACIIVIFSDIAEVVMVLNIG